MHVPRLPCRDRDNRREKECWTEQLEMGRVSNSTQPKDHVDDRHVFLVFICLCNKMSARDFSKHTAFYANDEACYAVGTGHHSDTHHSDTHRSD